jgi:2',3'-cyclic-nucleotide 2'-phosphodiesterase/3'-nucleotidase
MSFDLEKHLSVQNFNSHTLSMHNLKYLSLIAAASLVACSNSSNTALYPNGTTVTISLLETTDIHQNLLSYNYYSLTADTTLGLERGATLIASARAENPNVVLLDDGDNIQGTLLGDLQAQAQPIPCTQTLAMHKVMNYLKYDGAGVGNHEFNYGLPFLSQVTNTDFGVPGVTKASNCGAPTFPIVLTNVDGVSSAKPIFKPYAVLDKAFVATKPDGTTLQVPMKIGILGFVPPQIMQWDQKNLEGKVVVNGVVESANKYIPEMRTQGANLIVALSHGGLDAAPYSPKMENASYYLTNTDIDALMVGHSHLIFPTPKEVNGPKIDASFTAFKAALPAGVVDEVTGLVNGKPTVMGQSWGRRLGIIKMTLVYNDGKWTVQKDKTSVESRGFKYKDGTTNVDADPAIAPLIDTEHKATIAYASGSLGTSTEFPMNAYFSLLGDVSAIQIVNQAQQAYVKDKIATDPSLAAYKGIPVLSTSAPFKAGRNGPSDFTDVATSATPASPVGLQVRNPGDLYTFSNNNLQAVKIKGKDLRAWLEVVAGQFGQIDPTLTTEQDLVPSYGTVYNFDVFYADNNGLQYQIDVTKAVGSRIANLTYNGTALDNNADFIVATNDYRAGGKLIPALDGSTIFIKSPDANQDVVAAYIKKSAPKLTYANNGSARSWSFVKTTTAGPVFIRVAPGKFSVAQSQSIAQVTAAEYAVDASGFGKYRVDLSK